MRLVPAFALLVASLAGSADAAPSTRAFSVTGFDRIAVAGPFDVSVHTGPGVSVRASGDTQALDRLNVTVDNGLLRIRPTTDMASGWSGAAMGRVKIAVTVPSLRAASLFGSGGLAIDRAKANDFRVVINGSGDIGIGALQADSLMISVAGSGNLTVAGKATTVRASVAGSGDVKAGGLASADATIAVTGSGDVTIAAARTANVSANGSGDVVVTGSAKCAVAQHGSGDVSCGRGG